jgi:serine phosphatase RsbU (regulator of sigma subunit)
VASAHIDPVQGAVVEELRERYPPIDEASIGIPAVLRTGNPELYPLITDEMLADAARDEEQLRLVRALGARSAMIVPMRVGDRTVGAMMFVSGDGLRQYGERDLNLALELATRAGTALDNAQVHRERSEAADTLQRSLLPAALPELPGWSSATLYRPADQGNRIGGDFYDIVVLEDGFFVLVGDVTGKGVKAAALTALARHSTRTAALLGVPPAGTLAMLNRILLDQPGRSIITMLCAKVTQRPGGTTVTVASGGHPLPLRSRDGEPPIELGAHGLTLGWSREGEWSDSAAELAAGDGLLFYTDGVTDTAGSVDRFGDARLRELLMSLERGPDAVIAGLDAALHAYQSRPLADDVAVVSLQLHSHVSPAHSGLPINSPRARLPA